MTFLRVMTLNNLYCVPQDEIEFFSDVWANRAAFNVNTLKRYDADIIGLQEFEPIHWATYQQELDGYQSAMPMSTVPAPPSSGKSSASSCLPAAFSRCRAATSPTLPTSKTKSCWKPPGCNCAAGRATSSSFL